MKCQQISARVDDKSRDSTPNLDRKDGFFSIFLDFFGILSSLHVIINDAKTESLS